MREFHGKIPNTFNFEEYLFYFSRMKVFFDVSHLTPKDGDELLLKTAIETTKLYGQKIKVSYNKDNSALVFFVRNFLELNGQFYYEEEAQNGFVSLIEVLEEILKYIRMYVPKSEPTFDKYEEHNYNAE